MSTQKLDVVDGAKSWDLRGYFTSDDMYYLALVFQEADGKARVNRKSWRVIEGGKVQQPETTTANTGQLSWIF